MEESPVTEAVRERQQTFAELFDGIVANVRRVIRGKDDVIRLALLALVAEGHVLIEDAPGVGKTSLAKAIARSIDTEFGRIQFTPDLLPADVVGVTVWDRRTSAFEFRAGPVFAGVVLADEINRASPKTQSALLEAMGERQVTVDGRSHELGRPFMVLATQNPLDHEGTYPLPESQLDRFLMRLRIGYPSRDAELEILASQSLDAAENLTPVVTPLDVRRLAATAETVHVAPALAAYLVDIAHASRRHASLRLGISPRAILSLQRVSQAAAAAQGRDFVVPDDVKALATPVLAHRVVPTTDANLRGLGTAEILTDVISSVPVPRVR
jgi:MoxR-like ATPase